MVGLSTRTIRIWERRYRLTRPWRSAAGNRRYRVDEVQLLQRVKYLIDSRGATPVWPSCKFSGICR
jgi:DNA-binding transcriptional MerR regulator